LSTLHADPTPGHRPAHSGQIGQDVDESSNVLIYSNTSGQALQPSCVDAGASELNGAFGSGGANPAAAIQCRAGLKDGDNVSSADLPFPLAVSERGRILSYGIGSGSGVPTSDTTASLKISFASSNRMKPSFKFFLVAIATKKVYVPWLG
jgi:hypothetical protein